MQQPMAKNGYTNPNFDKLYGKSKNPWHGTERDLNNKKTIARVEIPDMDECPVCKGKMFPDQKLCGYCWEKQHNE
jgi:hypothetical protein